MVYEYLPVPSRSALSGALAGDSTETELNKLNEKARHGGENVTMFMPFLNTVAEDIRKLKISSSESQINTDTILNKFPLQGQDQNMQRSWTGFSFAANWADYSAAWACGYRRTSEGLVYLRGIARTAAGYAYGGAGSIITTLPVGFRPTTVNHAFPAMTYDAGYGYYTASIVYIDTAGNIQIVAGLQSPGGGGSGAINSHLWLSTSFWVY